MKKEYERITVSAVNILKTIDEYCKSGWKYLSICNSNDGSSYILIFEREINKITINTYKAERDNRAEMLAKYPEYSHIAMDKNREWFIYTHKPRVLEFPDQWTIITNSKCSRIDGIFFNGNWKDSLYSKEKQKVWIKANESHIGKEGLEIRIKTYENFEWRSLIKTTLFNKIYGIDPENGSYIFKSKNSHDMYCGYKFCEALEEI